MFLVSLLRTGETIPVRVFPDYQSAIEFCERTTPCNNGSRLLDTPGYECVKRAIAVCCPEGRDATITGLGWSVAGFLPDGTVSLHCTMTADDVSEFPAWVEGEYECC